MELSTIVSVIKSGSTTAATSKMECFMIIFNGWKPLTIKKRSILDIAAVLDPPLIISYLEQIFLRLVDIYLEHYSDSSVRPGAS